MLVIKERHEKAFLIFLLDPTLGAQLGTQTQLKLPHE